MTQRFIRPAAGLFDAPSAHMAPFIPSSPRALSGHQALALKTGYLRLGGGGSLAA